MTETLAVEVIDQFMLADDRDTHPMNCIYRLGLSGEVSHPLLREAITRTMQRHPLLRSTVKGDVLGRRRDLVWEVVESPQIYIDFGVEGEALRHPEGRVRIDLQREIGVRFFVRQGKERCELIFQYHHATADGIGGMRFIEDMLHCYAHLETGAPLAWHPIDKRLLLNRGRFYLTADDLKARRSKDISRILLFFRKFPASLSKGKVPPPPDFRLGLYPAAISQYLSSKDIADLRTGARKSGATVNDTLITSLFRALDAWNASCGKRLPVRVAIPLNMRRRADAAMPAANVVSMCFMDRSVSELSSPDLHASVARETSDIKLNFMGYALIYIASNLSRVKGGIKRLVTPVGPWKCHSTAVLTNIGRPFVGSGLATLPDGRVQAGSLIVDTIEPMAPVRPGTHAAFGCVEYAGRLHLTMHYDHTSLSSSSATELLRLYGDTLRSTMVDAVASRDAFRAKLLAAVGQRSPSPFRSLPMGKNVGVPTYRVES